MNQCESAGIEAVQVHGRKRDTSGYKSMAAGWPDAYVSILRGLGRDHSRPISLGIWRYGEKAGDGGRYGGS